MTDIVQQYRMQMRDHAEKRSEPRQRALKGGLVTFFGGYCTREATVRSLSRNGARLDFEDTRGVPPIFDVAIGEENVTRAARVRWQSSKSVGVQFVTTDGSAWRR
ncbi:hypothetical protein [Mesorhizobium xinjiangense]|uniref:hypothetical protein n=1 Tax=Mesorhizobium xinjiangense TaxID=2678685 RepID=UPI0012ECC7E3|nr:hypothetical protein [Mesorhizobium xinjiangense]